MPLVGVEVGLEICFEEVSHRAEGCSRIKELEILVHFLRALLLASLFAADGLGTLSRELGDL